MAKMIPLLTDLQLNDIPSRAEAKLYRSLRDNLPDTYVVLFVSVKASTPTHGISNLRKSS